MAPSPRPSQPRPPPVARGRRGRARRSCTIGAFRPRVDTGSRPESGRPDASCALLCGGRRSPRRCAAGGGYWYFTAHGKSSRGAARTSAAARAPRRPRPRRRPRRRPRACGRYLHRCRARWMSCWRRHGSPCTSGATPNRTATTRSSTTAPPPPPMASNGEAKDGLQRVADVLACRFDERDHCRPLQRGRADTGQPQGRGACRIRASAPSSSDCLRRKSPRLSPTAMSTARPRYVRQAQQSGNASAEQLAKWRAEIAHRSEDDKVHAPCRSGCRPHPRRQAHRRRRQRQELPAAAAGRGARCNATTQRAATT